jgi:uncharacterized protein YegL
MGISINFTRFFREVIGVTVLFLAVGCSAESNSSGQDTYIFPGKDGSGGSNSASVTDGTGGGGTDIQIIVGGSGNSVTGTNLNDPNACAKGDIRFRRITPVVMFVVDRTGSTNQNYGGTNVSRWQALHDALMDPSAGVIMKTQNSMYIGMLLFDGGDMVNNVLNPIICMLDPSDPSCQAAADAGTATCPRLIDIPIALNNYDAIAATYNMQNTPPGGTTPTLLALQQTYQNIEAQVGDMNKLDQKSNAAPFVILVTDGEPNGCGAPVTDAPTQQAVEGEIAKAAQAGVKTYVIGMDTPQAKAHLDKCAQNGDTGLTTAFTPANKDELTQTLTALLKGASCQVQLQGNIVKGYEDKGTVTLNSDILAYSDPNGYTVVNSDTVGLQGKACERFMSDPSIILHAQFPCEGVILK